MTVWSPYRKDDIDAVESVQRRATRILPELRGIDYEARLRSLKIPTLTYRRMRGDVINVYKYIHGTDACACNWTCQHIAQYIGLTRPEDRRGYVGPMYNYMSKIHAPD